MPWIADLQALDLTQDGTDAPVRRRVARIDRRLLLSADVVTCASLHTQVTIFEHLGLSAALVNDDRPEQLDQHVRALSACRDRGRDELRILMIGPVNSPHMEDLALRMKERGHIVQAGGAMWGGGLGRSALPDAGIPLSLMTWPQILWLRRAVKRFHPHVIHANWMPFAILAAVAGARPLVAMAWGSDVYLAGPIGTLGNRLALRRAEQAVTDSGALRDRLIELGAHHTRVQVINWGVDLKLFRPASSEEKRTAVKRSLGLNSGPVIVSPRGLKAIYNPTALLEALSRVLIAVPSAQVVLKHQGEELGPLADSQRVHLLGHVAYERLAAYFQAADVCVSIPSSDSSPRSVWEAMASGAACVLSDLPWVHELIEPGVHALVVPPEIDAVAEAITRLLAEPELRRSIASHGRALVEDQRDAEREMDKLQSLYLRLASRG
jgi:glycosyltransferase involved in cell wall biosynthesis